MPDKPTAPGFGKEYLESIRAFVSEGGQLSHENAVDLLDEVERGRDALIEECAIAAEQHDRTGGEWIERDIWKAILQRAGENVRRLKTRTTS
jgi:hypothetical protein